MKKQKTVVLSARIPLSTMARLNGMAKKALRSRSNMLLSILRAAVQKKGDKK